MLDFVYSVCNMPDEDVFFRQCAALEKNIPGLKKEKALEDVDGSLIQPYRLNGKKIVVKNSYYTGDVHVESEIDLKPFFVKTQDVPVEISAEKTKKAIVV